MIYKDHTRKKHIRDDGWLTELISMGHDDVPFECFHSYLVIVKPNRYRAMHFHFEKEEWLALTSGRIKVVIEDIFTKERKEILLDEDSSNYSLIYIPPKMAHVVKNVGEKNASLVVFSKTSEIPEDTEEYEMEV